MEYADLINCLYEFVIGILIINNCRVLYHDKSVAGVSIVSTIIFATSGVWNLYYYPSLNQWASFIGDIFIISSNILYIVLLIKYTKKAKQ
jgi:hypothetical protein